MVPSVASTRRAVAALPDGGDRGVEPHQDGRLGVPGRPAGDAAVRQPDHDLVGREALGEGDDVRREGHVADQVGAGGRGLEQRGPGLGVRLLVVRRDREERREPGVVVQELSGDRGQLTRLGDLGLALGLRLLVQGVPALDPGERRRRRAPGRAARPAPPTPRGPAAGSAGAPGPPLPRARPWGSPATPRRCRRRCVASAGRRARGSPPFAPTARPPTAAPRGRRRAVPAGAPSSGRGRSRPWPGPRPGRPR